YTITDQRVVLRVGIVLTVTFNLPLKRIDAAATAVGHGASGDIALSLEGADRIAYLHLWPHARPWHVRRTQPMLRCIANAPADAPPVAQHDLRFVDAADGSIAVLDATDQRVVDRVVGESGFVRGTLPGLARERKRQGLGSDIPFRLVAHADGRLTLLDPATNR